MYKTIPNNLGFGPDRWEWPEGDDKLVAVLEHIPDIDLWIDHVKDFTNCVQAGGATGVFPLRLSHSFETVYTFEPQPENFHCLTVNAPSESIVKTHGAVGNRSSKVSIHNSIHERRNYGAGYIVNDPNGVAVHRIDDLKLESCGLIMLDIEGAELEALEGARDTIVRCKPLVVLEDKPLPQMGQFGRKVGDPFRFLAQFGYEFVAKHRWDSVYKC